MESKELHEHFLGRKAYEAYANSSDWKSAVTGRDLPNFDATPPAVQKGWFAVGIELYNLIKEGYCEH